MHDAKLASEMPMKNPTMTSCVKSCTLAMAITARIDATMTPIDTRRLPTRSASTPSGMRPRLPSSTGTAIARLVWNGDR